MVENKEVQEDVHQIDALKALDRLYKELEKTPPQPLSTATPTTTPSPKQEASYSFFGGFFSKVKHKVKDTASRVSAPKGVYLHGGVGCGKTFCMNLFYQHVNGDWKRDKQHVHFHKFMLQVHQQMHEAKMIQKIKGDPLPLVVTKTLERGRLICFDEFQVTDVADALILRRLFTGLLQQGAVIVATSNRPPQDLYLNGLQRDLFLPFIDLLQERLNVVSMWDSETDYRLVQGEHKERGVYFIGRKSKKQFEDTWRKLTKGTPIVSTSLSTQGRTVPVPMASLTTGVARFAFEDLCQKALGAADYLVIGQNFHTVFVENVPKLTLNEVNYVRRFIIFVDSMYESNVKLIIQAATKADEIFEVDITNQVCDEVFAFDRTRSRLEEMASTQYLQKRWSGATMKDTELSLRLEPSHSDSARQSKVQQLSQ
jgi:predicted ATPase